MMRLPLVLLVGLLAAGCSQKVPDSGAQAGGDDWSSVASGEGDSTSSSGSLGADTLAALNATSSGGIEQSSLGDVSSSHVAPVASSTIASTAAPVASAPRAATGGVVTGGTGSSQASATGGAPMNAMAPSTITSGTTSSGAKVSTPAVQFGSQAVPSVNLFKYAQGVQNAPGEQIFDRPNGSTEGAAAACRKYAGPDLAQIAFLQAGGPVKDTLDLDPDGDGFACGWDPAPFKSAN